MNPYRAYRPSDVEWIGDMPEHWSVARLGDVADLVNGFPFDSELFDPAEGVPLVRIRDLFTLETEVRWAGDPVQQAEIGDGDILIGMDGDFNVAWWRQGRALLNQRLCRVRALPAAVEQRFAFYCLPFPLKALNDVTYATTVKHLSSIDVLKFRLPLPPLDEQRGIAAYLDQETERIDALVAKKRQLIERLQEYRTALITRTVTRGLPPDAARAAGLDPSPRLKSSGVEWLGEVPEHWEVVQPSFGFARIGSGTTPQSDSDEYYDGETPWVTTSELRESIIRETAKSVTAAALRDHSALSLFPAGALVIAMYGATIGRLGILGIPATVNQACCVFAEPTRLETKFVYHWLMAFRDVLVSHSAGGGQPNLSQQDLRALRIPAPAVAEQLQIGDFLDTATEQLDQLTARAESATERLQEYRTALITAAVTGKIDVRGAATKSTMARA